MVRRKTRSKMKLNKTVFAIFILLNRKLIFYFLSISGESNRKNILNRRKYSTSNDKWKNGPRQTRKSRVLTSRVRKSMFKVQATLQRKSNLREWFTRMRSVCRSWIEIRSLCRVKLVLRFPNEHTLIFLSHSLLFVITRACFLELSNNNTRAALEARKYLQICLGKSVLGVTCRPREMILLHGYVNSQKTNPMNYTFFIYFSLKVCLVRGNKE